MKLPQNPFDLKKSENLTSKTQSNEPKLSIDQPFEPDYEAVRLTKVGLAGPLGLEGFAVLKTDDGKEFPISAFSAEVAKYISNFIEGNFDSPPTVYHMIEQICEDSEIFLVKVKVYSSGDALRANLYFAGKQDLVLRNFRASDAITLATFYNIPILLRKDLLQEKIQTS